MKKNLKKSLLCQEKSQKVTVDVRWYLRGTFGAGTPVKKSQKVTFMSKKNLKMSCST